MEAYENLTYKGASVHCYNVGRTQLVYGFDPSDAKDCNYAFGRDSINPVSCVVALEPLLGEYAARAIANEKIGVPKGELQENSACLVFTQTSSIDHTIKALEKCKETLTRKIKAAKREEYRKKFCGQIVNLNDWKVAHPEVIKRIDERNEKQISAAVSAMMFRESFGQAMEVQPNE